GQVTGEDVGAARQAHKWARDLHTRPWDRDAARALGQMIVPPDSTGQALDVLAVGPLGKVPLAALRDPDGALIIRKRPLGRILALRPGIDATTEVDPPTIIADPTGDLLSAAKEGFVVNGALGGTAQLSGFWTGSPATRARLRAARYAEVLHIAAHVGRHQRVLLLADGEV